MALTEVSEEEFYKFVGQRDSKITVYKEQVVWKDRYNIPLGISYPGYLNPDKEKSFFYIKENNHDK